MPAPLVLIVEDDPGTRKLLRVLINRGRLEADAVPNGRDALLLLENVEYDALVLDLMLPGTSGDQVLAALSTARPELLARTIVLSASSTPHLDNVRLTYPGVTIVRKPFDLDELTETLARIVGTTPARRLGGFDEEFARRSIIAGAKGGIVVELTDGWVRLLTSFGYTREELAGWFPARPDMNFPICLAIRHARPIFLQTATGGTAEFPLLAPVWARRSTVAIGAVPVLEDGLAVGAAGWAFRDRHAFHDAEREAFVGIAAAVAPAISAAHARAS